MKNFIKIILLTVLFVGNTNAQKKKITVSEDAFIQGGDTADKPLGETAAKHLRIFNSNANSKYARIAYLKFNMPKKLKSVKKATLHFPLKVYKNEKLPTDTTFNLEIFAVENDRWRELSITWNDALELGELLASVEVGQSLDGRNQKLSIPLDAEKLSKLFNGKKDRKITLALVNSNFNKISAMAPSKEQSSKAAAYLEIE
ncbi:CBM96 family carbohydrate-binding protein [Flavicella sediminum]|uniref:CBM96 family carbohydrate-binding protein n=1 Tax=Flavicella sediminum TaxID=2585141 RepID=UPI001122F53C|nr:DNRLRE domain-containing protein [Flavicella sediminum]